MVYRTCFFLLFIWLFSWGGRASAQNSGTTPGVHSFSVADYGGGTQNWGVTQDEEGLIYVANTTGVLRFDGAKWSTLLLPGMPTVRAVRFGNGRLYAGGYGEFGYFDNPAGSAPSWHSLSDQLEATDRDEEIWNIELLDDGKVIFQSFGRIFLYDGSRLSTILPPGVMLFAKATGNELLVPVTGNGLYRWTQQEGFVLLPGSSALGNKEVVSIIDTEEGLILGTSNAIYLLREERLLPFSRELNERLRGQKINRLQLLHDGTLSVATINSGLFLFTPANGQTTQLNESSGLSNNTVLALFESRAGNLWLALDRGLDLVVRSPAISFVTGGNSPPGMVYSAAYYNGAAYFGTNQGLFLQRETTDGFTYSLLEGTSGQVWELQETGAGLLCGHNEGTFLVRDTTARKISGRSGGWMTIPINEDSTRFLQATYTGLQSLEWTAGEFVARNIDGFSAPIRFLCKLEENRLLAIHGSRGGFLLTMSGDYRKILRVDTLSGEVLTKTSALKTDDGYLLQNAQGRRLLRGDSLVAYDKMQRVPLRPGEYYLGGDRSGYRFVGNTEQVKMYQAGEVVAELPLRLRFPYPGIIPWTEDRWLFLLDEGYALVTPDKESGTTATLLLRAGHRPYNEWEWFAGMGDLPSVPYGDNDISFSAALPLYDRAVKYRSRLKGYAEEWTDWSASSEWEFTNLPEGDYDFEVEANWYGSSANLTFRVLPPWYRSSVAYLTYAFLFAVLLWFLYRLHLQRLRNQARRLEVIRRRELQRERIITRNRELEDNIKRKSRELANTTLTLAKKNEMLLQLREEIVKARRNTGRQLNHHKMSKLIDRNLNNEEDWAIFESHFNEVHEAFLKRLRKDHPLLTTGDLKLAAYLRMDLSSKEIAPLLHISLRGVENKRYRLRKKMELESGDDLNRYLLEF